jgi:hypothetical protein
VGCRSVHQAWNGPIPNSGNISAETGTHAGLPTLPSVAGDAACIGNALAGLQGECPFVPIRPQRQLQSVERVIVERLDRGRQGASSRSPLLEVGVGERSTRGKGTPHAWCPVRGPSGPPRTR